MTSSSSTAMLETERPQSHDSSSVSGQATLKVTVESAPQMTMKQRVSLAFDKYIDNGHADLGGWKYVPFQVSGPERIYGSDLFPACFGVYRTPDESDRISWSQDEEGKSYAQVEEDAEVYDIAYRIFLSSRLALILDLLSNIKGVCLF